MSKKDNYVDNILTLLKRKGFDEPNELMTYELNRFDYMVNQCFTIMGIMRYHDINFELEYYGCNDIYNFSLSNGDHGVNKVIRMNRNNNTPKTIYSNGEYVVSNINSVMVLDMLKYLLNEWCDEQFGIIKDLDK